MLATNEATNEIGLDNKISSGYTTVLPTKTGQTNKKNKANKL